MDHAAKPSALVLPKNEIPAACRLPRTPGRCGPHRPEASVATQCRQNTPRHGFIGATIDAYTDPIPKLNLDPAGPVSRVVGFLDAGFDIGVGMTFGSPACTCTGTKPAIAVVSISFRHVYNNPVPMPCRRATSAITVPGCNVSSTIRSLSSGRQRRCRSRRTRKSI